MTLDEKIRAIKHRVLSLKPPGEIPCNPITTLQLLNRHQWALWSFAFLCRTWDGFDFFTVSLTINQISATFHKTPSDITWGITVTLMLRSVGAVIFGYLGDRFGRKWPFAVDLMILVSLELGTSFVQTFEQFVVVRALFGIAMGGMYGNVSAIGLEDSPVSARGILSGLLQEGFALGYMIAAVTKLFITTTPAGWRAMFWVSAVPPALLTIWRMYLPETNAFKELKRLRRVASDEATEAGLPKPKRPAMKHYLLRLIYLTLLMGGFNFMSHGSQDLYPTFLQRQLGFTDSKTTVTIVVMNLGAILGGALIGHLSTFLGRRLSIIIASVLGAAVIPAWTLLRTDAVMAGAFFEQFFVQGAWGVVPIHVLELSPDHARTFVMGVSYQLGNLISSASSTIEATVGERFPLPPGPDGVPRFDYGKVMAIFMCCVFIYVIVLIIFGPEQRKVDEIKEMEKRRTMEISPAWADTVNLKLPALDFSWRVSHEFK